MKKIANLFKRNKLIPIILILVLIVFIVSSISTAISKANHDKPKEKDSGFFDGVFSYDHENDSNTTSSKEGESTTPNATEPAIPESTEDTPNGKVYFGGDSYMTYGSEKAAQKAVASEKNRWTIPLSLAKDFTFKVEPTPETARVLVMISMVDDKSIERAGVYVSPDDSWTGKLDVSEFFGHQITLMIKAENQMALNNGYSYVSIFIPEEPVPEKQPAVTTAPAETEPPVTTVTSQTTTPTTKAPQTTTTTQTTTTPSTTKAPSTTSKPSTTKPHTSVATTTEEPEETEYVYDEEPEETEYVDDYDEFDGDIPEINVHDCDCNCYWCSRGECYHCLYTDYYLCTCS